MSKPVFSACSIEILLKNQDWTLRPEDGIRHYSGTATYRKRFDLAQMAGKKFKKLYLHLGKVNQMARVKLNGKDIGVVWTALWRVEISNVVSQIHNRLDIEVVNLCANRLIGDELLWTMV